MAVNGGVFCNSLTTLAIYLMIVSGQTTWQGGVRYSLVCTSLTDNFTSEAPSEKKIDFCSELLNSQMFDKKVISKICTTRAHYCDGFSDFVLGQR